MKDTSIKVVLLAIILIIFIYIVKTPAYLTIFAGTIGYILADYFEIRRKK